MKLKYAFTMAVGSFVVGILAVYATTAWVYWSIRKRWL